ncbi:MAG: hypothetical protein KIT19_04680 [Phycisphaeraceae bacterium]|nr:hypothetical protein [Phycisphaeraceae bacterium]
MADRDSAASDSPAREGLPLPEETRYLSRPAGTRFRGISAFVCALGALSLCAFILARPGMQLERVFAESGLLERTHPWSWLLCVAIAAFGCWRGGARRDVSFHLWAGFLSFVAGMRELDLHVLLNPENIHILGLTPESAVRFRSDWWTDPSTDILVRIMWAAFFIACAACFFVPLICARVRWKRLLLGLDSFAWTFAAACGFVGLGYVTDDLLLRLSEDPPPWGQLAEESAETVGVALIACALLLAIARGHHARAVALLERTRRLSAAA